MKGATPGCVPNSLIRGMFVELGDRAFGILVTEWFAPRHALELRCRGVDERPQAGQGVLL